MKTLTQTISVKAPAHEIYEVLMDSAKHGELTNSVVDMPRIEGAHYSVYGGDIEGTILKLIPDKKIVQTWRYSDWPQDHFSTVTFSFSEKNGETSLQFTQKDIPDDLFEDIKQGWNDYYWTPLGQLFA